MPRTKKEMTLSDAIELMGWTTPKSPTELANLARQFLDHCKDGTPLRYLAACTLIIRESETIATRTPAELIAELLEMCGDDRTATLHLGSNMIAAMRASLKIKG